MAEENTTDLTPTTTDAPNPGAEASSGSTTDQTQQTSDAGDTDEGTILTGKVEGETDEAATDDDKTSEANPYHGAPDGDYELTGLPEGTVIDEKALEAIAPIARELNLSSEGLSKIAGVYAEKVLPAVSEQMTDELQRNIAAQHADWGKETIELIKTDAAFKGNSLEAVKQVAAKTLDRFGGEDFRKFLDDTGLGNHPAMVKFAYLAGTAISEDTSFERGGIAPQPKSSVEKFYGPQNS